MIDCLINFSMLCVLFCSSEDSEPAAAKPEKPVEVPWSEEDTDVVHLTENTFSEFIQAHGSALVMFYAPCKFAVSLYNKIESLTRTLTEPQAAPFHYIAAI